MSSLTAEIDLSSFRHNLESVGGLVGEDVSILPVIKANAYGHGVLPLAREALKSGVPMLGLGTLEEGLELRKQKVAAPILLIDGIFREEAEEAVKYHLTPVVFSLDTASELNRIGVRTGKKVNVHLKFDTGMSRLGFPMAGCEEVLRKIKRMKNLNVEGLMTHLAASQDTQSPQTENQLRRFDAVLSLAGGMGVNAKWIHAANSGGIINYPSSRYNMVRPGIMLYGCPPSRVKGISFKPVMTLKSRIIMAKTVGKGEGIGYDATYVTPRQKRIGVVLGGYADGINRMLSNRGGAIVHDTLVPILGNVCMDFVMLDLSRVPEAGEGDEVILLGGQHEKISAEAWAGLMNTISYEVFCGIGNRVKRLPK